MTDRSLDLTFSTMPHCQPSNISGQPGAQSEALPSQQSMLLPMPAPQLDSPIHGRMNFNDVITAVIAQPGMKYKLDETCREMGLGQDVSVALEKTSKRGIEEVSDPAVTPSKKPKSKKLKMATDSQMQPGSDQPEQSKPKKAKNTVTCVSCREVRHISQFPKRLPSALCTHGREMCRMCIIAWIRSQVQDGLMPRCALCKGPISYAYVEGITKKKYDRDVLIR